MTDRYTDSANTASDFATVGFQTQTIHGDVYSYVVGPDAPAEKKFEVGVRYLNGGVPSEALPLIERAIAEGYDTSEVQFYRILALISGRTSRQFSSDDNVRLDDLRRHDVVHRNDNWADGVRVVLRLLDSLFLPGTDPAQFIKALDQLHVCQKEPVLRHTAMFLKGPLGDQVWLREVTSARAGRSAREREKRVGLFFLPPPAGPRAKQAVPASISSQNIVKACAATAFLIVALSAIGWELFRHGSIAGSLGYAAACIGACFVGPRWVNWRWAAQQQADHERLFAPMPRAVAPAGGFAAGVDHRVDHYFALYVPDGIARTDWLTAIAGIRDHLRDELVEIYRDQRIRAEQLDWLIRYEVGEVKRRWNQGTLYMRPDKFRERPEARAVRWSGMVASLLGGLVAAAVLLRVDLVIGVFTLGLLLVSGYRSIGAWTRMVLEQRRAAADAAEYERKITERKAAAERWSSKLENTKPSDQEMAEWLDCDKKMLLERALQHYSLKRSDVISYAALETPSSSYQRASVRNGPWRYTSYRIVIFLLTKDGIRQITFELITKNGDSHQRDWRSYRFDAIASVHASVPKDGSRQRFELHLVNGETISFQVAEPITQWNPTDSDEEATSAATQDATGLRNTLRVLEGVGADGKGWIARETQLQDA